MAGIGETMVTKRKAGAMGLAPRQCVCDPMDLAALGHMLNCPCNPKYADWCEGKIK